MELVDRLAADKLDSALDASIVPIEVAWRANRTALIEQKKGEQQSARKKAADAKTAKANTASVSISAAETLGDSVLGAL